MQSDDQEARKQRLGRRLRDARVQKGLSQFEVGRHCGQGKGTVSAWETGRSDPGAGKLVELAKLYAVTPDSLLLDRPLLDTAAKVAFEFDQLQQTDQQTFLALWNAYVNSRPAKVPEL
jgi:HTH-type transcriptional regulator, cell division transcriptional repressor